MIRIRPEHPAGRDRFSGRARGRSQISAVLVEGVDPSRDALWQQRWAEAKIAHAERRPDREKFYAIVAYPGSSGFIHLGHVRGLSIADALHRYHRMRGRQVFFPTGTHASGLPSVAFAQRVADRDETVLAQLRANHVPPEVWDSLKDPEVAARFLGESYLDVYRRLGFLFDESAYLTTIDEDYRAFIQWQFRTLHRLGALVEGPYFASACPVCGPVSVDPSESDLATGGDAEVIRYTTVPFPLEDGRVLLTATLRPETVYGVTNLWIHPREPLIVWHQGTSAYLVSQEGARHLMEQHGGHLGHEVRPEEILGRAVRVPLAGGSVPVLTSPIVDPRQGTGVVMSVPAHAPADWLALAALSSEDRARAGSPSEIIFIPPETELTPSERELLAGDGVPAARAARATGAVTVSDAAALHDATERLYRLELRHGKMLVPALGPIPVEEARERMENTFEAAGTGFTLQRFSKPVRCRNGHEVVIRRVPDQWFLGYGDPTWKRTTHESLRPMTIQPEEYRSELPGVIDWFENRPCTRKGRWLGTPFPLDPSWIIEPIADSTFYPAYFVLRRFVHDGRITAASLTDALFDFVLLGRGAGEPGVDRDLQDEMRAEFTYWYPLDLNIGGKEHKRVHFPVFLYTHALLLPPELRPKGVFVHWWLSAPQGGKISKKDVGKKGGTLPTIVEALDAWGADAIRLFYFLNAQPSQDIEWNPDLVDQAVEREEEIARLVREGLSDGPGGTPELDLALSDAIHGDLTEVRRAFDTLDVRAAAQTVYIQIPADLRRYVHRGGSPGPALRRATEAWIRTLSPITPHLAEELGEGTFSGLVATQPFPDPEQFEVSPIARAREAYLAQVEEDLRSVIQAAGDHATGRSEVVFYLAAPWKTTVERWMRESSLRGTELLKEVMGRATAHPELSSARGEIAGYVNRIAPRLRGDPPLPEVPVDEVAVLRASEGYLARKFRLTQVSIHREEEAEAFDPMNRRARARPGRPAFYFPGVAAR
jgi:leucyl-tRNA synthetase